MLTQKTPKDATMKICMLVNKYPNSPDEAIVSGETKNPFYLSQALKGAGHDVTVITHNTDKAVRDFNGVKIYDIGEGLLRSIVWTMTRNLREVRRFLELASEETFDIIHAHIFSSVAGLAYLRKVGRIKTPIISTAHGTSIPEFYANLEGVSLYNTLARINEWMQKHVDRFSWLHSDKVISVSEYQIREMIDIYKLPEEKVVVISNGVDTSFYKPDANAGNNVRGRHGLGDKKVVLFVGRLVRKKGVQYLIDAAPLILKEVPNTIFLIIGGTDQFAKYDSELQKRIESSRLGEEFVIVKDVSEKDMPGYYNAADVCVFPSINYESFPTVIFEAMACGKPIVATNRWGIPEQIGYEDTLVPEKNSSALAKQTIEILREEQLAEMLSQRNRQSADRFDWRKIAKKHEDLYNSLRL